MSSHTIILASASPRRTELLREAGVPHVVIPARADEIQPEHLSPHETAQINAYRKARLVAKHYPDAIVIGADTIVCLGSEIFGKPASRDAAIDMLMRLEGQSHEVVTGVCMVHQRLHRQRLFAEGTTVSFKLLTPDKIREYLSKINPMDKAGAYAIQEHGEMIVERISGSYSNVVGLPVERVLEGLALWNATECR
jgi:septum formation protein